jgi:hypothetical protein
MRGGKSWNKAKENTRKKAKKKTEVQKAVTDRPTDRQTERTVPQCTVRIYPAQHCYTKESLTN